MKLIKTHKNGNYITNIYNVNSQKAVEYINFFNSQKEFVYENFTKGNFHANGKGFAIRYDFNYKLLTVTIKAKSKK